MSKKAAARSGSTRLRPDGRWEGRVRLGNGKRKSFFGQTEAEVRKAITAAVAKYDRGLPSHDDGLRLREWLTEWLEDVVKASNRPRTVEGYASVIARHITPELGHVRLTALTPSQVRCWLASLTASGLAPRTVRNAHAVLRRALVVAYREEKVSRNVAAMVSAPQASRPELRCFDESQALAFLRGIERTPLGSYFVITLALGLRRGEACALRWSDCDFDRREVHINGALQRVRKMRQDDYDEKADDQEQGEKKPKPKTSLVLGPTKTYRSQRPLPMLPIVEKALKAQRARQATARLKAGDSWEDNGLVFASSIGTLLEPRNVNRALATICAAEEKRAAAEGREPAFPTINVHGLRHSMVTLLRAQGIPDRVIAELAGHSRVSTTSDVYGKVLDTVVREAAGAMEKVLSGQT